MREYFNEAFCINGLQVAYKDLSEVAYSLVKEGEPYEKEIGDFLLDWIADSPEILQMTSGSTGEPKPIQIAKSAMVRSAMATGEFLRLREGTRAVLCIPAGSIAGKMMLVRAMVLGWKLFLVPPSGRPLRHWEGRVDFIAMVPLQLYQSLEDLGPESVVLVGGGPVSAELRSRIPQIKASLFESYGMTETASHVALRQLAPGGVSEDPKAPLPPFRALPGITFEQDERGCLVVRAPYLPGEAVITNDLVELVDKEHFRWLGRADHVVNSGGIKLIPEQLETKIGPLLDRPFFLTGIPDPALGEKLVLVLEGEQDSAGVESLLKSADLSTYEVPREIFCLPEFILTETGKINRPETARLLTEK